ncbi:MAG TPA: hypothetical protein VNT56_01375 [Acidimicrobiales bacterium]|jgi:hypothetical protein|nr:hypothetical protein [Acidimicrobiales bacterium]
MSDKDGDAASSQRDRLFDQPAFPYVVIRHLPAVYERRSVQFVIDAPPPAATDNVFLVYLARPAADGLAEGRRGCVVAGLSELSGRIDRRSCAVFGPEDAIYVEPSGETRASVDIPRSELHWGVA